MDTAKTYWRTVYDNTRRRNRIHHPSLGAETRLALNVTEACRGLRGDSHRGHAAGWLQIAADFRRLGNTEAARQAVARASAQRRLAS